jgi:flagellar FliL protein
MKADPKAAEAAPAAGGKKKLIILIAAGAVLVAGLGGGAAWFFLHGKSDEPSKAAAHKKAPESGPPNFVPIDPFTVNLQPENGADQYLQLAFTVQVPTLEDVELIKLNMPKVRSRLLLLLSGKHASEISTPEGKQQLAKDIIAQLKEPFEDKGTPQEVTDVLFTSFIIQ